MTVAVNQWILDQVRNDGGRMSVDSDQVPNDGDVMPVRVSILTGWPRPSG